MRRKIPAGIAMVLFILAEKIVKVAVIASNTPYMVNSGFSLGLLDTAGLNVLLPVSGILVLTYLTVRYMNRYPALWLMLSGGVANLSDRFIWGGVIDYIDLGPLPLFNVADLLLLTGGLLIVVEIIAPRYVKRAKAKIRRKR